MKTCEYGCGQEAKFQFKNGKWCCSEHLNRCPITKNNRREKAKKDWEIRDHSKAFKKCEKTKKQLKMERLNPGLCEFGCGLEAKFQTNGGRWICAESANRCPVNKNKNSKSILNAYENGTLKKVDHKKIYEGLSEETKRNMVWCKGKTKETDNRLKKCSETIKKRYENGELIPSFLGKHHSEETKKKLSQKALGRTPHKGCGRGKHGWYKGYWCDSSWELAWVIYNIDHNIKFERNNEGFEYEYQGEIHKFYPDFIMEDKTYIEIKGWLDSKNIAKINSFKGMLKVINGDEIKPFIKYVEEKYGKSFIELYDGFKPEKKIIKIKKDRINKPRKKYERKNKKFGSVIDYHNGIKIINDLKNQPKIEMIKNSDIDFSKFGWVNKVSEILKISPQKVNGWMKRNMLDFYNERCFKRHIRPIAESTNLKFV